MGRGAGGAAAIDLMVICTLLLCPIGFCSGADGRRVRAHRPTSCPRSAPCAFLLPLSASDHYSTGKHWGREWGRGKKRERQRESVNEGGRERDQREKRNAKKKRKNGSSDANGTHGRDCVHGHLSSSWDFCSSWFLDTDLPPE